MPQRKKTYLMLRYLLSLLISLFALTASSQQLFTVSGSVLNKLTRKPIPYVTVMIEGQPNRGAATDSLGRFTISRVEAGIFSLAAFSLGYESVVTPDYIIAASTPPIEIELTPSTKSIDTVVVTRSVLTKIAQNPINMRRVGLLQLEKSAGANRDMSRVVQSYPGVAFSPAAYRNDLIVRGGAPAENSFYIDGFSIPNINHFATQGASGGPVSLINSDLIREIDFYSGTFPVGLSGALSSIMDVQLRDGNTESQEFKATLGAAEVALSGSGHFSDKTTYIFSVRQSYLQLLFKAIGLPFLPNFIDGQFKIKSRLSRRDEITIMALGGVDRMKLNKNATSVSSAYILGYLPRIEQETYTVGVKYRRYMDSAVSDLIIDHSYINNRSTKYRDNDESSEQNLLSKLYSHEHRTRLRSETKHYLDGWTLRYGGDLKLDNYRVDSRQRVVGDTLNTYRAHLSIFGWGLFGGGVYTSASDKFTSSIGTRLDGCDFSNMTSQFWRYFSPRGALSYSLGGGFSLNAGSGIYYQLPPLTALSYMEEGELLNRKLSYMRVAEFTAGADWRPRREVVISVEGFLKDYSDLPLSIADGIPLADKGNDYGTVGNEALSQTSEGRAFGVEFMGRWKIAGKLSAVGSVTLFRSEYRATKSSSFIASAWDNRFIINLSANYVVNRKWALAAKLGSIGGAPTTPYNEVLSARREAWDLRGRASLDYSKYHSERLPAYTQLDVRVDRSFYFTGWSLGLYVDVQNLLASKYIGADIPVANGEILNPLAAYSEQLYGVDFIPSESGVVLPTIGVTIEF